MVVGEESSARTWPSLGTGSKSSGGHGRKFGGSTQLPGASSTSARSTGGVSRRNAHGHT